MSFHAVGAVLFAVVVLLLVAREFLTPADPFANGGSGLVGLLRFAVTGLVFYGLSLGWLQICPVGRGLGLVYAVCSWVLLVSGFFPELPDGGMMRRVADPVSYEATKRVVKPLVQFARAGVVLAFGVVQLFLLLHVRRRLRPGTEGSDQPRVA